MTPCACGKNHPEPKTILRLQKNALAMLPDQVKRLSAGYVFLLCDRNTWKAAGENACEALLDAGIRVRTCILTEPHPDEQGVGRAIMGMDPACDCVCACGGGVLNDIGKIAAHRCGRPYIFIATAPSMDGFASATSSVDMDGLKVSLSSKAADAVIGDLTVLAESPMLLRQAGVGDMLAKYVSLAEWRAAHLLLGEEYCPVIAAEVECALEKVTKQAPVLLEKTAGDREKAAEAVTEGLVLAGTAMLRAGLSRPASGMEHYISHIWDMRTLSMGTPGSFHGIQCALGTLMTLRGYEFLRDYMASHTKEEIRARAEQTCASFSYDTWAAELRSQLGAGAEEMIAKEQTEGKYDPAKRAARTDVILTRWAEFAAIFDAMPDADTLEESMRGWGMPVRVREIGITLEEARFAFLAAKDIRDKYVLGRMLWDLGILEEAWEGIAKSV